MSSDDLALNVEASERGVTTQRSEHLPRDAQTLEVTLTFRNGELAGRSFVFESPRTVCLGRIAECDVMVPDHRASRRHCAITLGDGEILIADLGSSNGTFVNGARTRIGALRDQNILRIGDTEIRIGIQDADLHTGRIETLGWEGELPPPRRSDTFALEGYTLRRCVGEGAHGVVFEAVAKSGAVVAIKFMKLPEELKPEDIQRFEREAKVASLFQHPNVVRILDHGRAADTTPYIVMEFVEGESVRARMKKTGPLPVAEALAITRQVAHGLEYARQREIVHRDVKPDNIVIQEGLRAKLTDFGLAKSITGAGESGLTRVGHVVGTLAYMSPEQLNCSVKAEHRSDVYSLGATLFHMLAGEPPFPGPAPFDYVEQIIKAEPRDPARGRRDVLPVVSRLVLRCLSKKPEDRYQTAGEIVTALDFLLADATARVTKA